MKKIKINVEGMTCEHCVTSVNKAINRVKGVIKVDTSLSKKESTILALDDIKVEDIKKNIENAGYTPLSHETAYVSEAEEKKTEADNNSRTGKNHNYDYDLIIIGGGSAKRLYKEDGKKYAEIETGEGLKTVKFDEFLMATGVVGNTEDLNLEAVGVETYKQGFIKVDGELKTTNPDIYACGDVTGLMRLVTTAAYDGKIAAGNMLHGKHIKADYSSVAHTTFTDPEVSSVGLTEEAAIKEGYDVIKVVFPVEFVPKAQAIFKTEGLIKMIADKKTNKVIGIHMLAHNSSETIQQPA